MSDARNMGHVCHSEAAAISAIDVHVDDRLTAKFADKRTALDALARHLGMFQDLGSIQGTIWLRSLRRDER